MATFEASLALGRLVEDWTIDALRADGWAVIAHRDLPAVDGHGPRAIGADGALPDLQATKYGRTCAIEVKAKTEATWWRIGRQHQHGIDRKAFDAYRAHERLMPTFLLVVEVGQERTRRDAYIARITEIRRPMQEMNRGVPMVYWPRDWMTSDWLLRLNRWASRTEEG